ncbi:MAG: YeeE/YedE thiosulfate transporter family protein [Gammaproteobacteria bacterium]
MNWEWSLSRKRKRLRPGNPSPGRPTWYFYWGGFLVGMGTQMAGGCSSGHGLSGCANLSWSSLLATGIFFSTAVVVANAIKLVM